MIKNFYTLDIFLLHSLPHRRRGIHNIFQGTNKCICLSDHLSIVKVFANIQHICLAIENINIVHDNPWRKFTLDVLNLTNVECNTNYIKTHDTVNWKFKVPLNLIKINHQSQETMQKIKIMRSPGPCGNKKEFHALIFRKGRLGKSS